MSNPEKESNELADTLRSRKPNASELVELSRDRPPRTPTLEVGTSMQMDGLQPPAAQSTAPALDPQPDTERARERPPRTPPPQPQEAPPTEVSAKPTKESGKP